MTRPSDSRIPTTTPTTAARQTIAALIVLVVFVLMTALLAWQGSRHVHNPTPQRSIESVKEDIAWAKRLIRRD